MDYEFIDRLQKNLDEYYQLKFNALFNAKEFGDLREIQGSMKAIKKFSEIISESANPKKKEAKDE